MDQSADNLNHLLENLLDWSLSQTNGIQCVFEKIPLHAFFQQIASLYKESLAAKEITLLISVDDAIALQADQHTLATAFRNLLSNAIKFTPRGGTISIDAIQKDNVVVVHLSDTGVGINKEKLCALFTLQGQRTTCGTEKEKGTGLGLILVKEFTELNHGTLTLDSTPSQGTRFTLTFPA